MWAYLWITLGCGTLFTVAIMLASKNGSKAAQLEALKAELKKQAEEQQRAQKITNTVDNMPISTVDSKLQSIANKDADK